MPWYFPWSDSIKKRACRYLLQHYLGHFLQEKLTLEQLTVDLYNGTGKVENVPLDVWSVNEMLESASIPFELVEGYIESIEVGVPWTALLNDNCTMNIKGLEVTIAPRQPRTDSAVSMTESMIWNTMTTSMQLAQECLKQGPSPGEEQAEATQSFEGLESFAQTIESVLARIKVSFTDTVIRLEHLPKDTKAGIAVEIHVKRVDYTDLSTKLAEDDVHYKAKSVYERAAFACKNLKIFGVSVHLNEFHETAKTVGTESPPPSPDSNMSSPPISPSYYALSSHKLAVDQFATPPRQTNLLPSVMIACCAGNQELKLKIKQNLAVPGPKIDVECYLGTLNVFLSPRQIYLLLEVTNGLKSPDHSVQLDIRGRATSKPMQPEDYQRIEQDLHNQLLAKRSMRHHEGQQRVDSWNFSLDSFTSAEDVHSHSTGTDYDSILSDDGEDKFYSMASAPHSADILPPLEEPPIPADMLVMRKGNTCAISPPVLSAIAIQGMGYDARFMGTNSKVNIKGPSLTEAASSIFVSTHQAAPAQQGQSHGAGKTSPAGLSKTFSPPSPPGLAGIAALEDPSPDQSKLKLQLSSIAVTVLHVDPVLSPSSTATTRPDDVRGEANHPLSQMSDHFFKTVGTCRFGQNDFEVMRDVFDEACSSDHLRCLVAPLSLDFERTNSNSRQEMGSEVSVGKMELLECLYERSSGVSAVTPYSVSQLLSFVGGNERPTWHIGLGTTNTIPCVRASYKSTHRTSSPSGVQARNTLLPKTELTLQLGKLYSEVDISIIDRLTALIYPQPLYPAQGSSSHTRMLKSLNPSAANQQAVFTQAIDEGPTGDQRTSIHVSCPALTFVLRFPIPDLRPAVERRPWWKQSLRDERLLFDFSAVEFKTTVCGADLSCDLEFRFRELEGQFQLGPHDDPQPVLHVSPCQIDSEAGNGGFDWPRLVISVRPTAPLSVLEEVTSIDNSPLSSLEAYPVTKKEPSPFSSKSVMYETEELVMPGSQEELAKFQEDTLATSKVHIECSFPQLDVNLHTKDVFEQVYNRIASDLLLWEPTAPSPVDRIDPYENSIGTGLDLASQLLQAQGPDKFVMCKSGIRDDDFSSDEEESSSLNSPEHKAKRSPPGLLGQSFLALTINAMKGRVALFPSSTEPSGSEEEKSNKDTSKQDDGEHDLSPNNTLGQEVIELDDITFFLVACYKGRVDLSYLCLQSKKASLFHAPVVHPDLHKSMESTFSGAELQSTIHPSEAGVLGASSNSGEPMLAFSVKTSFDSVKNVKEILFALLLRDGTLRHRNLPANQTWINQMMSYMDVKDDVILGFVAPAVVTVFHAHLWNCAVDYRPIHLPLRVLLTIEAFSISSNITIESTVSLLRFIVEDAALHLSDRCSGPTDLKNYVCIMDLGLFELSLYMSDGSERRHPKLELRMSNNTLNIRTCSDSCSALLQLIQYIAADGDLVPQYTTEDEEESIAGTPKRSADPPVKQISVDESEMSSLMKEAMDDAVPIDVVQIPRKGSRSDLNRQMSRSPKPDLFLFPDDQQSRVEEQLNELNFTENCFGEEEEGEKTEQDESDDEFCILEHPEKELEANLSDEVIIKCFVDDKITIVENHFMMPFGRWDQMRAPDHYPPAVYRYTLKEMSVVWQLYGGHDLGTCAEDTPSKKRITFAMDEARRRDEKTSHRRSTQPLGSSSPSQTRLGLRSRAGRDRDSNVLMELQLNKIRFQYEEYPEDTDKASRLVLLAHDVEIRDRLAHSQINKFLYQYTSESMPKQTHANMVLFKMLYIRPEPTNLKAEECCLRVSIQPLRLNIDQDALFFLKDFFAEIADGASKKGKGSNSVQSSPAKSTTSSPSPQLISCDLLLESPDAEEALTFVSAPETPKDKSNPLGPPTFFRSVVFSPEVPIRLDYQGKRVDMDQVGANN